MVIVNKTGEVDFFKSYDTYRKRSDAVELNEKLLGSSIGPEDIILIATGDAVNGCLQPAKEGIESILCNNTLPILKTRDTLTVIGSKARPCPPWFFMKHLPAGQGPGIVETSVNLIST